jgi:hypothetical protein
MEFAFSRFRRAETRSEIGFTALRGKKPQVSALLYICRTVRVQ